MSRDDWQGRLVLFPSGVPKDVPKLVPVFTVETMPRTSTERKAEVNEMKQT
jgi:hypothetical protein